MRGAPTIAVVGGGIAGLAAAALLATRGLRVTIFEQSPRPGPIGAGLLLQPTGLRVLEYLGLRRVMEGLGAPVHRLEGWNHRGRVVMDLAYADLHRGEARTPPLAGLGVHRGALFSLLHARALTAGARLVSGARITGLSESGDHWRLKGEMVGAATTNRTAGADGAFGGSVGRGTGEGRGRDDDLGIGDRRGGGGVGAAFDAEFDLVVVADGARSVLRSALCPRARARAYRWGACWFVARDEAGAFDGALRQIYRGTRSMVGWLPTGRAAPDQPATVSVFWSVRVREMDALREMEVGAWRRRVLGLAPMLEPLVSQVVSPRDLISAVYMDVDCPLSPRSGVVVLGDAAHATSPQLGQGANLALMDALALAEGLERYPLTGCGDVENDTGPAGDGTASESVRAQRDALAAWLVDRRRASIRFYQRASRWLTPWFQSGLSPLAWPRDMLMGPMARVPWIRRQMLLSLAGVKTGALAADEEALEPGGVDPARSVHADEAGTRG